MTRKTPIALALSLLLAGSLGTGCVKQRAAALPDGAGEGLFSREQLEKAEIVITTAHPTALQSTTASVRAAEEGHLLRVTQVTAPAELKPLFSDLDILSSPGGEYRVVLRADEKNITAYKVVDDTTELTTIESQISAPERLAPATRVGAQLTSGRLVPIFQYAVGGYGTLVRTKNDLGEETSTLRVKQTDWSAATHVQIQPVASARTLVPVLSEDDRDEVFVRSKIDGKVFTTPELRQKMQVRVALDGKFSARVDAEKLNLFEVTTLGSSHMTPALRPLAERVVRGSLRRPDLQKCGTTEVAASGSTAEDCVLVLRYQAPLKHVTMRLETPPNEPRLITAKASAHIVAAATQSPLVLVYKNPQLTAINSVEQAEVRNPSRMLPVSLKRDQFLFRRTLQDSPNTFDYTFPGTAGDVEIVRFVFDRDRVRVVRSDALMPGRNANDLDREVLISLPAHYYKDVNVDDQGNPLAQTRAVTASHTDDDAYAVVDWNRNLMPDVSSPLTYYGLGQCFFGGDRSVTDVDARLDDGMFNFSLVSNLSASPGSGCVDLYRGYFDAVQSQYTFKERVSFRKYTPLNGEQPLLSVPYEAQKQLGFGLFTFKRMTPNRFGNTGRIGTETPLPSLWHIQDQTRVGNTIQRRNKQIHYILAGLPPKNGTVEDRDTREAVIRATREVVADLNRAFRQALAGTVMRRADDPADDVVTLQVEGDDAPKGELGDLDRNYIYYVAKKTSSGIIGLGGSGPNPRSGIVENGSVFIYGGNIFSSVESMRLMETARADYARLSTPTPESEPSPEPGEGDPRDGGDNRPPVVGSTHRPGMTTAAIDQAIARLANARMTVSPRAGIRWNTRLAERLGQVPDLSRDLYVYEAIQEAIANRDIVSPDKLAERISGKFALHATDFDTPAGAAGLDASDLEQIRATPKRAELRTQIMQRLNDANICVYHGGDALHTRVAAMQAQDKRAEKTDLDYMISIYKPTLAHELGHNVGLRHNFISSFDRANHKFAADDASTRTYSSVMDYLADDHDTYDGYGPQDIAALRAAYAGLVELHPMVLEELPPPVLAQLPAGKYIDINRYRQLLGVPNWESLSESAIMNLPIKRYLFCSDEDAGWSPTCNRFDRGTTPLEIVNAAIADYRSFYSIRNFPGNRLRFDWWDNGSYIGGLFGRLLPVRQFLEETFYQAIQAQSLPPTVTPEQRASIWVPYAQAAARGLWFFHEIIRTPEASRVFSDPELQDNRFTEIQTPAGKVTVERKWTGDQYLGEGSSRMKIRGIEFDKVIALIMLTQRQFGFPRYEQRSIRISYPEFERMFFRAEHPLDNPTVELLTQILSDNITPIVVTPEGRPIMLGTSFKVETSSLIRTYGIIGAILNLDVNTIETTNNLSSLFRMMSGFTAQSDRPVLVQPGTPAESRNELRYWAGDNAHGAMEIVKQAHLASFVASQGTTLSEPIKKWVLKKIELDASAPESEARTALTAEYAAMTAAIDEKLATLPESVGPRKASEIEGLLTQLFAIAARIQAQAEQAAPELTQLSIEQINAPVVALAKNNPILALVFESLPMEELKLAVLPAIVSGTDLGSRHDSLFGVAQLMNRIFYSVHPEYAGPR